MTAALVRLLETSGSDWSPEAKADALWSDMTRRGNQALERGEVVEAERCYDAALEEASRLFREAAQGGAPLMLAPMLHTISCHNSAEIKRRSGDLSGAFELAIRALDRLSDGAEAKAYPLALRINCVRHMAHAAPLAAELVESAAETFSPELLARARTASARAVISARRLGEVVPFVVPELAASDLSGRVEH